MRFLQILLLATIYAEYDKRDHDTALGPKSNIDLGKQFTQNIILCAVSFFHPLHPPLRLKPHKLDRP